MNCEIAKLNENKTKQEEMKGLTGTKRKLLLIELFAVLRCIEIHKKSSTEVSNAFRFKATDDAFWIDDYDIAKIVVLTFVIDVVDSVIYFVMKLFGFSRPALHLGRAFSSSSRGRINNV